MCFLTNLVKRLFGQAEEDMEESNSLSSASSETVPTTVGKKRALCFGINDYPSSGNDLRGCLQDVSDWSKLLKDVYKFDEIINITDANCTKENVIKAMGEIIEKSVAGDVVVFSYSGHGTYVIDQNYDEEDGKDEAIYLFNGALIDDDIGEILSKIKDGVHATIIF